MDRGTDLLVAAAVDRAFRDFLLQLARPRGDLLLALADVVEVFHDVDRLGEGLASGPFPPLAEETHREVAEREQPRPEAAHGVAAEHFGLQIVPLQQGELRQDPCRPRDRVRELREASCQPPRSVPVEGELGGRKHHRDRRLAGRRRRMVFHRGNAGTAGFGFADQISDQTAHDPGMGLPLEAIQRPEKTCQRLDRRLVAPRGAQGRNRPHAGPDRDVLDCGRVLDLSGQSRAHQFQGDGGTPLAGTGFRQL